MACNSCSHNIDYDEGAKFCGQCGQAFHKVQNLTGITPDTIVNLFLEDAGIDGVSKEGVGFCGQWWCDVSTKAKEAKEAAAIKECEDHVARFNKKMHEQGLPTIHMIQTDGGREMAEYSVTAKPAFEYGCGPLKCHCGAEQPHFVGKSGSGTHQRPNQCWSCGTSYWRTDPHEINEALRQATERLGAVLQTAYTDCHALWSTPSIAR